MAEAKPIKAGEPGGSAKTEKGPVLRGRNAKERAMAAIQRAAEALPIHTRHPEGDPMNKILDDQLQIHNAPTKPI